MTWMPGHGEVYGMKSLTSWQEWDLAISLKIQPELDVPSQKELLNQLRGTG